MSSHRSDGISIKELRKERTEGIEKGVEIQIGTQNVLVICSAYKTK